VVADQQPKSEEKFMEPLVNKKYKLEKFHGKGGWTFVQIPEVPKDKCNTVARVKGSIDGYEITKYHLMRRGNGRLLLPAKAGDQEENKKAGRRYRACDPLP
jgi:hypothetical protein